MEKSGDENVSTTVTISRLMLPDDANNAGNVHGGTTLKMVEEAGAIVATRWCNLMKISSDDPTSSISCFALLARIEHMDFIHPIHIGQVAHVEATIKFTSAHSLLVVAKVFGEDIISGGKKLTNVAHMWYVPVSVEPPNSVRPVPPIAYSSAEEEAAGTAALERQKSERKSENGASKRMRTFSLSTPLVYEPEPFTAAYSRTVLCHMLGVSDVGLGGFVKGGVTLKMMDECGGITAMRHCQTFVVTASIEATNFHERVPKGALLTVKGQVVFTSASSIVTEVVVEFEQRFANYKSEKGRAVDAYFTYVSIDKDRKVQKVPQLLIKGPEEQALFDAAKIRYEKRKALRAAEKLQASPAKVV